MKIILLILMMKLSERTKYGEEQLEHARTPRFLSMLSVLTWYNQPEKQQSTAIVCRQCLFIRS